LYSKLTRIVLLSLLELPNNKFGNVCNFYYMPLRKLNLAEDSSAHSTSVTHHKKKRGFKRYIFAILIAVVVGLFFFFGSMGGVSHPVVRYVLSNTGPKIEQTDDRTNILLLGNAGGKHDGATLTDSIIVASYHYPTKKVVMFSIPRDLWVESISAKVNTVYQDGVKKGDGMAYSKQVYSDLMGMPIHYVLRLDFSGFEQAIDAVGGVEVVIPRSFDDYNYPIEGKEKDLCGLIEKEVELSEEDAKKYGLLAGKQKVFMNDKEEIATDEAMFACRFEHLHFDRGTTNLNGETALKFVRSRKGTNNEGSDFARSRRQQLVIQAFREKALSLSTLTNPAKVTSLISALGSSFETNIPLDQYPDFYALSKEVEGTESIVLGDLGEGKTFLDTPNPGDYGGAYVLVPPNGDFNILRQFVKDKLIESIATPSPSMSPLPSASVRKVQPTR
jgi:polyisoprenyl-teichoic acid--peptidoglycan teichoic acid transferase